MTRDADRQQPAERGSGGDQQLFPSLRAMWRHHDPAPTGLASSVIRAIAARDLADEREMLTPVDIVDDMVRGSDRQR